jgi:two-component system LytT family response regulator
VKALIVDDEPLARSRLARLLADFDDVSIVGEAANADEALASIRSQEPDVVFLDIRMPGPSGLELAASADDLPPIVFTTAHDEFAVEAFDAAAIDYLLKPVQKKRLARALERVRARHAPAGKGDVADQMRDVLRKVLGGEDGCRICAQEGTSTHLFDARELGRFYASDKYTVFQHEGREYLVEDSLNDLEKRLVPHGFFRVHRAELVNLRRVRTLHNDAQGATLVLADGQVARVSRRLLGELKRALEIR